jgi:hypothetical protein
MASPQREPQPHFEPELKTSRPPRTGTEKAVFAWWWILLTAVVIFALAWAIWGWSGTGGWWSAGRAKTKPQASTSQLVQPVIQGMGVEILTALDRKPFVGRNFQVTTVPVISKVSDQAVWIGTKTAPPMLLILNANNPAGPSIVAGSLLDVNGTIEKAPSAAQARHEWHLPGDAVSQLEKQGAYIQATSVIAIHQQ